MRLRRRSRLPGLLLLATALGSGGCGTREEADADAVLARFRGGEVTRAEYEAQVERQAAAGRSLTQGAGDWRVTLLEGLAVSEIAAAAAPEDPGLDRAIAQATDRILEAAMIERLGWNRIPVSTEEARTYYDEHPEVFSEPEKLRLQHIFLRAEEGAMTAVEREAVRRRLEGIRRQILEGADFAAMAREHSDSADGPVGGWMVLKRGARAVRSFTDVAWALEENQVSETIDTPTGFHIARLATRIAPQERPFEDVRKFATEEVSRITRHGLEEAFLAEKGPEYGFVRRYEALTSRDARDATALFYLDGKDFTVRDLLASLPDTYRPHFYAGYLEYLPRFLDQQALRRALVLEARAEKVELDPPVLEALAQATREARADFEIERRLGEGNEATSEEDLAEFYEQHRSRYETPRTRSVSLIRLAPDEERSLRTLLREGQGLVEQIRAGADFAEIARQRSNHSCAAAGGILPPMSDESMRMQIPGRAWGRQVIDDLEEGEVSEAFVGEVYDSAKQHFEPTGVYIVRLESEVPPRPMPFHQVRELVRADYLRRHHAQRLSELRQRILAENEFEVVVANLQELRG